MSTIQPRLSRVDFYRFRGDDFLQAAVQAIEQALGDGRQRAARWAKLNNYQQGLYGWWIFYGEVQNGGLAQFFYNRSDAFIPAIIGLLKASGNARLVPTLKQAAGIYRKRRKEFQVSQPFGENGLFAQMTDLATLDKTVGPQVERASKAIEGWLRAYLSRVVAVDGDGPPDPTFTGDIETHYANGKIFEQAAVRKGVLHGAYKPSRRGRWMTLASTSVARFRPITGPPASRGTKASSAGNSRSSNGIIHQAKFRSGSSPTNPVRPSNLCASGMRAANLPRKCT